MKGSTLTCQDIAQGRNESPGTDEKILAVASDGERETDSIA